MRITLLELRDYKRIKEARIVPGGRSVILIAGMNGEGKSSLLGSMSSCLGGKGEEPAEPIRDGAASAEILIELEDDAAELGYQVRKRFHEGGKSTLKVTGRDGKVSSPQKVLDRIVGGRFLDPLKFSLLKDKEQLAALLDVVDIGFDLDAMAKERKGYYDERANSNRTVKTYESMVATNPHPGEIPEAPAIGLAQELDTLREAQRVRDRFSLAVVDAKEDLDDAESRLEQAKKDLKSREHELNEAKAELERLKTELEDIPDVSEKLKNTQALVDNSVEKALEIAAIETKLNQHLTAVRSLDEAKKRSDEFDAKIKELDKQKAAGLAAAKMPVEGLSIGDGFVLYKGHPLEQASGAEKLLVSLALAAAMSPKLRDIWVEDGSLLDDKSMEIMSKFAEDNDLHIWLERVGESDDGAIVIEDGMIKGSKL